jgi:hypothetical protein
MRRLLPFVLTLALAAAAAAPALAGDPPYLKLAAALGAPTLVDSAGPADHSTMFLKYVPDGETAEKFTKLVTFSILKVPATKADTDAAARGVIVRLRDELRARHAKITSFDESPLAPVTLFYEFSGDGAEATGVVYSPSVGFVTDAQIEAKNGGTIDPSAVAKLKSLLGLAH